jgi:hypothetical protein
MLSVTVPEPDTVVTLTRAQSTQGPSMTNSLLVPRVTGSSVLGLHPGPGKQTRTARPLSNMR